MKMRKRGLVSTASVALVLITAVMLTVCSAAFCTVSAQGEQKRIEIMDAAQVDGENNVCLFKDNDTVSGTVAVLINNQRQQIVSGGGHNEVMLPDTGDGTINVVLEFTPSEGYEVDSTVMIGGVAEMLTGADENGVRTLGLDISGSSPSILMVGNILFFEKGGTPDEPNPPVAGDSVKLYLDNNGGVYDQNYRNEYGTITVSTDDEAYVDLSLAAVEKDGGYEVKSERIFIKAQFDSESKTLWVIGAGDSLVRPDTAKEIVGGVHIEFREGQISPLRANAMQCANGSVSVDNTQPYVGDTITISATPDEGYRLEYVMVTDNLGQDLSQEIGLKIENDSFIMPSMDVWVYAWFTKINPDGLTDELVVTRGNVSGKATFSKEIPDDCVLDIRTEEVPKNLQKDGYLSVVFVMTVFRNDTEYAIVDNHMTVTVVLEEQMPGQILVSRINSDGTLSSSQEAVVNENYCTIQTDETGRFLAEVEFSMPMMLLGDADLSGEVNVRDATLIQKVVAGLADFANEQAFFSAEVNMDGDVNIRDATAIQKYCAMIDPGCEIGRLVPMLMIAD